MENSSPGICVDVHTHLTDAKYSGLVIDEVITRAKSSKVKAAIVVTEDRGDFDRVLNLYRRYPEFVLPCLGIHPIQSTGTEDERGLDIKRSVCLEDYEGVESFIESHLDSIGGIGEVGLDFSPRFCKTAEDKDCQKLVLSKQVQLAQTHALPLNVHSRSAGNHTVQLLRELNASDVLLHAFDGRASVAVEGASHGFFFSVTANICRDPQVQKMVKCLPLDHLLLETDSPAIAPIKGEVNEPANVLISCEHIAKIKNVSVDEVKQITTQNAIKVFPKLKRLLNP